MSVPYPRSVITKRDAGRPQHRATPSPTWRSFSVVPEPVIEELLAANVAFYDAHERRDLDAMRAVWEHSERTVCIHPGWPILRTWPMVEESWRRIFEGPGRNQFILTDEAVVVDGDVGWVTLEENLVDGGNTGTVAATNLFVRTAGGWRLVVHHGSPVMSR